MAHTLHLTAVVRVPFAAVSIALLVTTGCSRRPTQASTRATVQAPSTGAVATDPANPAVTAHGSRKMKDIDVPVYVDGKPAATLRYGELHAALEPRVAPEREHKQARYFRIADYLAKIGVDVARVRAVHLRGNANRIASVDGDELAREPARFLFDFMEKDTGIARMRWDTTGLKNTFRVEEIRALLVYVERAPAAIAAQRNCYLQDDNTCSDKVPYAAEPIGKGTRIYLDGKLVGQVKRRKLGDELIASRDDRGVHFDLAKLLRSVGVDVSRAQRIELASGDDIVARGEGADLLRPGKPATFVLPAHQHGRVRVALPVHWTLPTEPTESREAQVTAVLVYQSKAQTQRSLTRLSDLPQSVDATDEPAPAEDG